MTDYKKIPVEELSSLHKVLFEGGWRQVTEATYSESTKITTVYYISHDGKERGRYILTPTVLVQE